MQQVAVIQMVSGPSWQENLRQARRLLEEAAAQGAALAVLPENFAVFNAGQLLRCGTAEQDRRGPIRQFIAAQAARLGIWIVAGSIPILSQNGDRVRSACIVVDNAGQERARYDKIHLFDVDVADAQSAYRESDQIEPGDGVVALDTPVGRLGLTICYDLRFPQLYQALLEKEVDLITVPAAFTYVTGEAHWDTLLRARAIETQCFILAANQGGAHNAKRRTWGHSQIIDPWGEVLALREQGEGVLLARLDRDEQAALRRRMPIRMHRRPL